MKSLCHLQKLQILLQKLQSLRNISLLFLVPAGDLNATATPMAHLHVSSHAMPIRVIRQYQDKYTVLGLK